MQVDLLVHGTLSSGQSFWKNIDREYCAQFYAERNQSVVMEAEILKNAEGKFVAYYTYLRCSNVMSSSRSGSYFGMTLRIEDGYCVDAQTMFRALDNIFHKQVLGEILAVSNDKYVYRISSFESVDTLLDKMQETLLGKLHSDFLPSDFREVPTTYLRKNGYQILNIDDASSAIVYNTLMQGAKLAVSPEFHSQAVLKMQTALNEARQSTQKLVEAEQMKCNQLIATKESEMNKLISSASGERNKLRKEVEDLQIKLQKSEQENRELSSRVGNNQLDAEIRGLSNDLKEPIKRLAEIMSLRYMQNGQSGMNLPHSNGSSTSNASSSPSAKSIAIKVCVLLAVFLLGFFISSVIKQSSPTTQSTYSPITPLVTPTVVNPRVDVNPGIKDQETNVETVKTGEDSKKENSHKIDQQTSRDVKKVYGGKINVPELSKSFQPLLSGHSYTFQLLQKNGSELPPSGYWVINGQEQASGRTLKYLVPTGVSIIKVEYKYEGKIVAERDLGVKDFNEIGGSFE